MVTDKQLVYLASPYSHDDSEVRLQRFEAVNRCAAILMAAGVLVFSPISHTHPIAEAGDLPRGWEFWEQYDRAILETCRALLVCCLDGWGESKGIRAELEIARDLGIPIGFLWSPHDADVLRHYVRSAGLILGRAA